MVKNFENEKKVEKIKSDPFDDKEKSSDEPKEDQNL